LREADTCEDSIVVVASQNCVKIVPVDFLILLVNLCSFTCLDFGNGVLYLSLGCRDLYFAPSLIGRHGVLYFSHSEVDVRCAPTNQHGDIKLRRFGVLWEWSFCISKILGTLYLKG
jgi:hypothetical protein